MGGIERYKKGFERERGENGRKERGEIGDRREIATNG